MNAAHYIVNFECIVLIFYDVHCSALCVKHKNTKSMKFFTSLLFSTLHKIMKISKVLNS